MIEKRLLVRERLRRPPDTGWSWVDRRFVREYAEHLSREAVLLYFFLAAVADRQGLSYYSDASTAVLLRLRPEVVARARQELLEQDLVAHESASGGLTQVLSVRPRTARRRSSPGHGLWQLGEVFRQIAAETTPSSESSEPRSLS